MKGARDKLLLFIRYPSVCGRNWQRIEVEKKCVGLHVRACSDNLMTPMLVLMLLLVEIDTF